jgi:zinc protease
VTERRYLPLAVLVAVIAVASSSCAKWPATFRRPELHDGPRDLDFAHGIEMFSLTNGMQVAMVPADNTNAVRVDVRYRVGAADDPIGRAGMAHVVEHMQFELRQSPDQPTIKDRLQQSALHYNAYTNWDETHYMSTALHHRLPKLLAIEADRLRWGCDQLDEDLFERERAVVRQEIAERSGVSADIDSQLRNVVFGDHHAYSRSIGGTDDEVARTPRNDVCEFIADHYTPDRAILVISGRFDPEATRADIGALFGPIDETAAGSVVEVAPVAFDGTTSRHRADVEEATAVVLFESAAWGQPDSIKSDFLRTLLAPRLEGLEDDEDLITDISTTWIGGYRGGASGLAISVTDPSRMSDAVDMVFKELDGLFEDFDSFEFGRAQGRQRTRIIRRYEPFAQRAMAAADYMQYTNHKQFMASELLLTDTIDVDQLRTHAARSLRRTSSHIAYITPSNAKNTDTVRVELPNGARAFDITAWKSPVDPADADVAVELLDQRPRAPTRQFTLDNGATVVLASDFDYPVIDVRVVFPAGDDHDPADKTGLAAMTAYLLDDDRTRPYETFDYHTIRSILSMGGSIASRTTDTATVFRNAGLSMYSDALIWQLHWRLESGRYDGDDLDRLKKLAARVGARDSTRAATRFDAALRARLYGDKHPYTTRPDLLEAIAHVSKSDLERFRRDHYRMNGATIIVTGQFDDAVVEAQIRRLYGAWKDDPPDHDTPRLPAPSQTAGPTPVAMVDEDASRPTIMLAFRSEAGFTTDYASRLVVDEMIRQRMVTVRETLGASYGVSVSRVSHAGPGNLRIEGSVDPGRAADALLALRQGLADMRAGEQLREDFVRARRRVLEQVLASSVDSNAVANELERTARYDLDGDFWETLPARVATLTPAAVERLIAVDLATDREVVVVRSTGGRAQKILSGAGFDDFDVID